MIATLILLTESFKKILLLFFSHDFRCENLSCVKIRSEMARLGNIIRMNGQYFINSYQISECHCDALIQIRLHFFFFFSSIQRTVMSLENEKATFFRPVNQSSELLLNLFRRQRKNILNSIALHLILLNNGSICLRHPIRIFFVVT